MIPVLDEGRKARLEENMANAMGKRDELTLGVAEAMRDGLEKWA